MTDEHESECACNTCKSTHSLNSTVAPAGPRGKSIYEVWLDAGNEGNLDDFIEYTLTTIKPPYELYTLDLSAFEKEECPTHIEVLTFAEEEDARPGDILFYETPLSINGVTLEKVIYQWQVIKGIQGEDSIDVALQPMRVPVYLRHLKLAEVCPAFRYQVDIQNGLRPHEFLTNTQGIPVEIYVNPSVDYGVLEQAIIDMRLLVESNISSAEGNNVTKSITSTSVLAGVQYKETPNETELLSYLGQFPDGTLINNIVYTTPLGRVINIEVLQVEGETKLYIPQDNYHIYTGDITAEQYAQFAPNNEFWLKQNNVIYRKRIKADGELEDCLFNGSGSSDINQEQLDRLTSTLRAEWVQNIADSTLGLENKKWSIISNDLLTAEVNKCYYIIPPVSAIGAFQGPALADGSRPDAARKVVLPVGENGNFLRFVVSKTLTDYPLYLAGTVDGFTDGMYQYAEHEEVLLIKYGNSWRSHYDLPSVFSSDDNNDDSDNTGSGLSVEDINILINTAIEDSDREVVSGGLSDIDNYEASKLFIEITDNGHIGYHRYDGHWFEVGGSNYTSPNENRSLLVKTALGTLTTQDAIEAFI